MWNAPNYTGELFLIGANQTPFLNMMGGLQGEGVILVSGLEFPLAQPWALEAASQPAITETTSLTLPTATTYVREQDTNTVQVFQESVQISYMKQSVSGMVTADGTTGLVDINQTQPVQSERDFQINANLQQIAVDAEYSFLNGTYQKATAANVAAKTRGIITAATTSTVNASSATLDRPLMQQLLRTMAGNGAVFTKPVIFCNAFQRQKLSEIYGYAPEDWSIGGVKVEKIRTDFGEIGIAWAPQVPAATLLLADMQYCRVVFCPVPDKGVLFYEEKTDGGAALKGQIYGQMGISYGPEEYHGTITSLATS
jgi:hypothetical protein